MNSLRRHLSDRFLWLLFALAIALSGLAKAQTSVALAGSPQFSSFLSNGQPNAFGCVFTYQSGTSTPFPTFSEFTGTVQNPNPVVLSAGGTANIWFQTSGLYRVIVKTSGGTNCASGSTLYTVDGVANFYGLLNIANTWAAEQTFSQPIELSALDFQIVTGASTNQTILDFPPPIVPGATLTFPNTLQTMVGRTTVDTLLNKTLITPQINNCGIINGPGTYLCITNNSSLATVLNGLVIVSGSPSVASASLTTTTNGVLGIVVAGAGITGIATIQQSGNSVCNFDGGTTAGDYFVTSSTVAGECHDTGSAGYPVPPSPATQVLGMVLSSGSGPQTVNLFGPGLQPAIPLNVLGQNAVASFAVGAGAGTGATVACIGVGGVCIDNGGLVSVTTGSSPSAAALVFSAIFGGTHLGAACTLWPLNTAAQALSGATQVNMNVSATSFSSSSGSSALAATTQYTWNYLCGFR